MAEVLGPMQVSQRALPTGHDATRIAQWEMRGGTSFMEFLSAVALAVGAFNQEMNARWGWLFSFTEELALEYPDGGSVTELQEITDESLTDMVHGQTIGHMIDLKPYGGSVGGTRHYFRDARPAQITSTIRTIRNRAQWRFEKALLTRALTNTENLVGSAGYDVPFVRGTGGNVDFIPPAFGGEVFTASHDHFVFNNSGYAELLNTMAETLEEHGHEPPYRALVSRADVASYLALTKFVEFVAPITTVIDRGAESSGNQFFTRGQPMVTDGVFGYFQSDYGLIELHSLTRIPTLYAGLYKSYGINDARNPLAVRVHPSVGFGLQVIPVPSHQDAYPIRRIDLEFEFGVSVGEDRTNGVVGKKAASYDANPTIS